MAATTKSVKQQLREYIEERKPAAITEPVWQELLTRLSPVSESYLRDLLRATDLPFEQPYAAVRQHSFDELEQSLLEMLRVYSESAAAGDRERARYCRRQVIAAKDRAKLPRRTHDLRVRNARKKNRDGAVAACLAGEPGSVSCVGRCAEAEDRAPVAAVTASHRSYGRTSLCRR